MHSEADTVTCSCYAVHHTEIMSQASANQRRRGETGSSTLVRGAGSSSALQIRISSASCRSSSIGVPCALTSSGVGSGAMSTSNELSDSCEFDRLTVAFLAFDFFFDFWECERRRRGTGKLNLTTSLGADEECSESEGLLFFGSGCSWAAAALGTDRFSPFSWGVGSGGFRLVFGLLVLVVSGLMGVLCLPRTVKSKSSGLRSRLFRCRYIIKSVFERIFFLSGLQHEKIMTWE